MYENEPVPIPDIPGKICFKNKKGSEYVQYETGRKYDPVRKYNVPERKVIGIRIPSLPEMMLPNENYHQYFKDDRKRFIMLRELFDQMYYEFQLQSRRKPDDPVNGYKAMKINSILEPLREIMGEEEYAVYLDLVDVSTETGQEGADRLSGKSYSDVALLLTQYKGAIKRFNNERM